MSSSCAEVTNRKGLFDFPVYMVFSYALVAHLIHSTIQSDGVKDPHRRAVKLI